VIQREMPCGSDCSERGASVDVTVSSCQLLMACDLHHTTVEIGTCERLS